MPGIQPPIKSQQPQSQSQPQSQAQQVEERAQAAQSTAAPAPAAPAPAQTASQSNAVASSSSSSSPSSSLPPELANFFTSNPESINYLTEMLAARRLVNRLSRESEVAEKKHRELLDRLSEARARLNNANEELNRWTALFD